MLSDLAARFPDVPTSILWKTELMFQGVRYSAALAEAVAEGAAEGVGRRSAVERFPDLMQMGGGVIARVRVDDASGLVVRREPLRGGFVLSAGEDAQCSVRFVSARSPKLLRTSEAIAFFDSGVERAGDAIVVDIAGGAGTSSVGLPGPFGSWSRTPGRIARLPYTDPTELGRLSETLAVISGCGAARHVWVTGEAALPGEFDQVLRVVEACRTAVGDQLSVTARWGGMSPAQSRKLRDAGADSYCYNTQTGDPVTFAATLPGKARHAGREQWFEGMLGAVEVFGCGRVASAFLVGRERVARDRQSAADRMQSSVREGAEFLLDRGVMPVYAPWQTAGRDRRLEPGLRPEIYLRMEREVFWLRASRHFPVPRWLLCADCSDVLVSVDFDRAFGLSRRRARRAHAGAPPHRRERRTARMAAC